MSAEQKEPLNVRQCPIPVSPPRGWPKSRMDTATHVEDGPSDGKLLPGDQILAINEEPVSDVPRERVIDLVRSCKDSIVLTVVQPQQSPKSAFISAAKKARLRTNPPKVRFSEQVSISDPDSLHPRIGQASEENIPESKQLTSASPISDHNKDVNQTRQTMLKDDSLLLIPNVLKVFLENGQIKSFTFDSRTTVRDVISSLQDRLSLRYIEHFALVLESGGLDQNHRLHLLQDSQPLSHVVQRTYFQGMKCLFRICFFPKDPADLLRRDPAAFEYLYIQSRNDVIKERFGMDWKNDITLKLAALHIFITVSAARPNQKISLKHVEKEWGLEPFLPLTLLPLVKEKNVCKTLSQLLKTYQHPPPSGNKVPPLQGKLQYMRVLNELPPFGGLLFHTVGLDEKQSATTLLVGPRHGISHVIDLKNNLTTVLAEFSRVAKIQLFRENQGVARVELAILEAKPLVLLMEWPDATNFACLIAGYYKLFVDPKKTIYCRTPGQSHIIKADYRSAHAAQRSAPPASSGGRRPEEREGPPRDPSRGSAGPPEPQHLGLCHLHLKELQELQAQAEAEVDINENLVSQEPGRPRTKSDPTQKSSESIAGPEGPEPESPDRFRGRAYTLEPSQRSSRFFCDSCKAKLKAAAEGAVAVNGGGGGTGGGAQQLALRRCSNACSSREGGAVDLTSLPLPGSEDDEEELENRGETLRPPPPAIAAPPPGFRDNSSDEDDPKRAQKAQAGGGAVAGGGATAGGGGGGRQEEVPITLIDSVATRTVRDHAQELDDALVSTLQALEALAASEDYPHPHQQPPQTAGLIVLAAITPESSLDSGHETNSSELTDVSEMVSAMKQNQTYLLAHHINKERLFSRRDFPLTIPACATQSLGGGALSLGQLRAGCPPKPVILSKTVPLIVSPSQEAPNTGLTGEQSRTQAPDRSDSSKGEPKPEPAPPGATSDTSPQATKEQKAADKGEKGPDGKDQRAMVPLNGQLSPKPPPADTKGKVSRAASPETTNKALPILLPVDRAVSAKIRPTNMCQDAETASSKTSKPSTSNNNKGALSVPVPVPVPVPMPVTVPVDDLFCTCPVRPEPKPPLRLKDPQAHKMVVFHSSSPTDDERLRAKAKGLQLASGKEGGTQGPEPSLPKPSLLAPPRYSPRMADKMELKEPPDGKAEIKAPSEPQKGPKALPVLVETKLTTSYADKAATIPATDHKKQGDGSASGSRPQKQQRSAPFLSFRNLLSATFPARLRRETDERQAQLQKVRQYELEFLEELLKPKAAGAEFLPPGPSPVPGGTPCSCQLRSSPVQKVPGVSREQRRSCDCKRLCRGGIRLPDTPVGSVTASERRGRERQISKTPPAAPKVPHLPEGPRRPHTLEIKTTRIRSSSLESREPRGEAASCLPTCTSRPECLGAPQYKKLQRRYSIGEAEGNESAPLYAEVKPKSKSLEKEMERVRATGLRLPTPVEPCYASVRDPIKRKGVFSIQGEELIREGRTGTGEVVLGLPSEDNDDREKCCSFCFCYRKCEAADESSEKDELSYSIPLQVLPGMQLDAHSLPVVSKTLQVLNAEDCSGEEEEEVEEEEDEEPQSQEIDLRACGTLEGSLARVQALQGKTFTLPDGFLSAQLDANELLAILRQCASGAPRSDEEPQLQSARLAEYKQELALRFKEFRASCRRVAGVEKSPTRMLSAVTASFQVLCSLTQTFIRLVRGVRSEAQRLQLLRKVEEVAINYTLLLRAAEESMGHSSSLPAAKSTGLQPGVPPTSTAGSLNRPVKTLITK